MSHQYPLVPLGDVCRFVGGGTPSRKKPEYFAGDIPWATVKDFKHFRIADTEEHISEIAVADSATNIVEAGTVLLVSRVGLGKVAIAECKLAINQDIKGLTPAPHILSEYLFWFLLSRADEIKRMGAGATVKGITLPDIKAIQIPVPPLSEQRRIVDILSRAEGIVRLRREAQRKAAELVPGIFLDMFGDPAANPKGWPVATIGDVIESADYGSSTKASENGAGLPLIRMGNVGYDGSLSLADLKHVELPSNEVEKYRLREGDILFNRTNSKELVGKTGLWHGSWDAVVASYFIRMRVKPSILNPFYLWAFMNSSHQKRVLFDTARGAIGQANINSKELKAFLIGVPPLNQQDGFERRCRDVGSIQSQQSAATAKAEAAFAALLAQVFSGNATRQGLSA